DPGVVAGHGPAAPEEVEQPVLLDAPGGQRGGPACAALDLDLGVGEEASHEHGPGVEDEDAAPGMGRGLRAVACAHGHTFALAGCGAHLLGRPGKAHAAAS